MSKELSAFRWGIAVTKVEIVKAINENFGGMALSSEQDTLRVLEVVNELLGDITEIGDLTGTGLDIQATGFPTGKKYRMNEDE
jgi:hypothetical protein